MIERFAGGVIPQARPTQDLSRQVGEVVSKTFAHLDRLEFGKALEAVWELVQSTNQYIDKTAPWKLAKQPDAKAHVDEVLFHLAAVLKTLGLILFPFMPSKGEEMLRQIGIALMTSEFLPDAALNWDDLPGHKIAKESSLFPKIEQDAQGATPVSDSSTPAAPTAQPTATTATPTAAPTAPTQITIDEFMKIQLKTAKVLTAERVPRSEKLIKLQVDLGSEQRQIVAGIGKKYEPEHLVGRTIVIVANLKPAKLMGIESQGMVLAAGDAEVKGLVGIIEDVDPGTKVK
jgi:methionyl-tRNA synthetase